MADIDSGSNLSATERTRVRQVCKLRELFHGRFTGREATTLLKKHRWDIFATVNFILLSPFKTIEDVFDKAACKTAEAIAAVKKEAVLNDLERRGIKDLAKEAIGHQEIAAEIRQFACIICRRMWWKRVPRRKTVSRCFGCRKRYDAILQTEEWGLGEFACECGHSFRAFAMMERSLLHKGFSGKSESLCHGCYSQLCYPIRILPPIKQNQRHGRRYAHACTAPNCYNRRQPYKPDEPLVSICVHPKSLGGNCHGDGSKSHLSTASTVDTFLPQDDIRADYEETPLDTLRAHSESD